MKPSANRRGIFTVADGTNTGAFDGGDWAITFTVAALWGSSFLWIAIGLDSFAPTTVSFGRVALGAAALWLVPAARIPIDRSLWPTIGIIAITGNAGPALLFAFAQQRVDSSVAGMINAATPIAVLSLGTLMSRRLPGSRQLAGIAIGFVGVATIAAPNLQGADAEPLGIALLSLAVTGYGISNNVIVAPQQRYGTLPIISRALILSSILLAPTGASGFAESDPTTASIIALTILGVAGTGIARALNATLAGRTGATRGSVTTYLVPVIAIILGVTIRHDTIRPIEILGTATILAGAWLTTRRPQ